MGLELVCNISVTRWSRCTRAGPGLQTPDYGAESSPRAREDRKASHRDFAECLGQIQGEGTGHRSLR